MVISLLIDHYLNLRKLWICMHMLEQDGNMEICLIAIV
jgi:hypothetical protein